MKPRTKGSKREEEVRREREREREREGKGRGSVRPSSSNGYRNIGFHSRREEVE